MTARPIHRPVIIVSTPGAGGTMLFGMSVILREAPLNNLLIHNILAPTEGSCPQKREAGPVRRIGPLASR